MIGADGFHDFAVREPGPPDREYPWRNSLANVYAHSLEGQRGSYSALTDPRRFPTGWTGTVAYDGTLYQHYPVWAGLAHGGPNANPNGPGYESEGMQYEPLTGAQVETWQRILADLEQFSGHPFPRLPGTRTGLVEHREAAPTACPSERYAPLYAALEGDMTPEQVRAIVDEAVGQAFLPLLKQAVGVDPSTFSDYAGVEAVRQRIALPPGFDPVRAMRGADQAYALNGVVLGVYKPALLQLFNTMGVPPPPQLLVGD